MPDDIPKPDDYDLLPPELGGEPEVYADLDPEADDPFLSGRRRLRERPYATPPRVTPEILRALAFAEAAAARADQAAAWLPPEIRLGLVRRMAWREAAGWLSTYGLRARPARLALEALEGGSGLSTARAMRADDEFAAADQVAKSMALARIRIRLSAEEGWSPHEDAESAASLLITLGASTRRPGDPLPGQEAWEPPAEERAVLDLASFSEWRQRWFAPQAGPQSLLTVALAAGDWLDAGCTLDPHLAEGMAIATATQKQRFRSLPPLCWAACAERRPGPLPARDAENWPLLFFNLVADASRSALSEAERLRGWQGRCETALAGRHADALERRLARLMAERPLVGVTASAEELGCSTQAVNRAFARLRDCGLAREATGREAFRCYEAA